MTLVIYEPETPAMEFIGHAGAGLYGQDPVCAALSILMYTLIEALPGAAVTSGDGYCRVDAGGLYRTKGSVKQDDSAGFDSRRGASPDSTVFDREGAGDASTSFDRAAAAGASFDVVYGGVGLLAGSFPQYVRLCVKRPAGGGRRVR